MSEKGPEEAEKESEEREKEKSCTANKWLTLHPMRKAQVSVTMAEKTTREGKTSDLAYS